MLATAEIYHTGLVVPDIAKAQAEFEAVFGGIRWTALEEREMPVLTQEGTLVVTLRFVYSIGPAPRIELLEPVEGTAWSLGAEHIGVWAEDFQAESRRLDEAGFPRVLTFDDGSGQAFRFAYHRLPSGALVELVDASRRPELEAWMNGDVYPAVTTT